MYKALLFVRNNAIITNYFIEFLQAVNVANSYELSFESTTYITFLFTNNYLPYQYFIKKMLKSLWFQHFPFMSFEKDEW